MSDYAGDPAGPWNLQCTLSLASCRLRAESLARRLHSKLWSAGRYEGGIGLHHATNGAYDRCHDTVLSSEPTTQQPGKSASYGANDGFVNGHCWSNAAAAAMFAVSSTTSLDGDEYFDCEGRLSSPPSPAEEEDIIVNPPVGLEPFPIKRQSMDDSEYEEYEESEEDTAMLSKSAGKMVSSNDILFEKLILIADSLNKSDEEDNKQECNGVVSDCDEPTVEIVQGSSPPIVNKFKFSVTPVVEVIPPPELIDMKSTISAESLASLLLEGAMPSGSYCGDEEEEDDETYRRRVLLRSTSLKTGKTPPGTPRRKKIVRFADALGLDLEAVRHIVNDDLPNVPASAFTDLKLAESLDRFNLANFASSPRPASANNRVFYPQFSQPVTDPFFLERVRTQKVSLENIVVSGLSIYGVVRVLNLSFEKSVLVRYTTDEWCTFFEVPGIYVPDSHDGFSDRFRFTLSLPGLSAGQKLVMAMRYITCGMEYWDNNFGNNYVIKCHMTSGNSTSPSNDGNYSFI